MTRAEYASCYPLCQRVVFTGPRVPQHAEHVRCYRRLFYNHAANRWYCVSCAGHEAGQAVAARMVAA